jgi:hypothetical protein
MCTLFVACFEAADFLRDIITLIHNGVRLHPQTFNRVLEMYAQTSISILPQVFKAKRTILQIYTIESTVFLKQVRRQFSHFTTNSFVYSGAPLKNAVSFGYLGNSFINSVSFRSCSVVCSFSHIAYVAHIQFYTLHFAQSTGLSW